MEQALPLPATATSTSTSASHNVENSQTSKNHIHQDECRKKAQIPLKQPVKTHWYDRTCIVLAHACGHWITFIAVTMLCIIWLATGPMMAFSDLWQVWFNTANTIFAFLLTFILQNRKNAYMNRVHRALKRICLLCQTSTENVDLHMEHIGSIPTPVAKNQNRFSRMFEHVTVLCADVAGSYWSFFITCVSVLVWLACGPMAHWSDTWQLTLNSAFAVTVFLIIVLLLNAELNEMDELSYRLDLLEAKLLSGHSLVCGRARESTVAQSLIRFRENEEFPTIHVLPVQLSNEKSILSSISIQESNTIFEHLSDTVAYIAGTPWALFISITSLFVWLAFGPLMDFNENFWLVVNTYTCTVTMMLLMPLQSTELRRRRMTIHYISRIFLCIQAEEYDECSIKQLLDRPQETMKQRIEVFFEHVADRASHFIGSAWTFAFASVAVFIWAISFFWQNTITWQLEINTASMIVQQICFVLLQNSMAQSQRGIDLLLSKLLTFFTTESSSSSNHSDESIYAKQSLLTHDAGTGFDLLSNS